MVLGLIDHDQGKLNEVSLEMLTLGRGLAEALGSPLEAILIGEISRGLSEGLRGHGVSKVYLVKHADLEDYAPEGWAQSVIQLMETIKPEAVLAPGTDRGSEVLAHVAARTGLAMSANTFEVQPGESYTVKRVRWGGSLFEEALLKGEPKLMTVAPFMLASEESAAVGEMVVEEIVPELDAKDLRVRVTRRDVAEEGVSLSDARVVVGGGRGVGSEEGFGILEELAEVLGGAVGGSRVATNNGWRPHADQIGQTGTRIAPDLYIACGISGAIQHWVGCMGSKHILVINTDAEAPIVSKADYAIIGDLHEIVPALSEAVRKEKGG